MWNSLADSMNDAAMAATGETGESGLRSSAMEAVRNLLELAAISARDEVLEIGCGVGRIGKEIAPLCRSWAGADISANMLRHASARLKNLENTRFIHLTSVSLSDLEENSFDVGLFMRRTCWPIWTKWTAGGTCKKLSVFCGLGVASLLTTSTWNRMQAGPCSQTTPFDIVTSNALPTCRGFLLLPNSVRMRNGQDLSIREHTTDHRWLLSATATKP